jgi:hypothetical protein
MKISFPSPYSRQVDLSLENWWDGVGMLEFRQHGDLHPEKAPVFAFKHLYLTVKGVDAQPI